MMILSRTLMPTDLQRITDIISKADCIYTDLKSTRILDECAKIGKRPIILHLDQFVVRLFQTKELLTIYCPSPEHPLNALIPELIKSCKEAGIPVREIR